MAYRRIAPDPETRLREIVTRGLIAIATRQSLELEPSQLDPWLEAEEAQEVTPSQAAAMFQTVAQSYGTWHR